MKKKEREFIFYLKNDKVILKIKIISYNAEQFYYEKCFYAIVLRHRM